MTQHQISTFLDLVESGEINTKRAKLYLFLRDVQDGLTLHELQSRIGWPMSTTSGRLSELLDEGVVHPVGKKFYVTSHPADIACYKAMRLVERRDRWIREGKKYGWL